VPPPGPPRLVIRKGSAKSCIVPMTDRITQKRMIGFSSGRVMWMNCCVFDTLSSVAAS
jgi:hypothetical protein